METDELVLAAVDEDCLVGLVEVGEEVAESLEPVLAEPSVLAGKVLLLEPDRESVR